MPNILVEIQQLQAEGLTLRYPEILMHPQITLDAAVNFLVRAAQQAQTVPFTWSWLDRPQDGQTFFIFLPHPSFPNDGIRWQEAETKFNVGQGTPKEMEVAEVKFGFVPGSGEPTASRIRRRYRLLHGGLQQLWIVHYSRGNGPPVPPALATQPVRAYPLRPVNEPALFVAGEKIGQKVYPPGMGPNMGVAGGGGGGGMQSGMGNMGGGGNMNMGGPMGNFNQQHPQALLAQQNTNMEMLEVRNRARAGPPPPQPGRAPPPGAGPSGRPRGPLDDDDSGDEIDTVSTRALALTRYKRNHDLMNEVFVQAAYRNKIPTPASAYSIFDKKEVDEKVSKLSEEIEALKAHGEERRKERERRKEAEVAELAALESQTQPQPLPDSISFDHADVMGPVPDVPDDIDMSFAEGMPGIGIGMGMGVVGGEMPVW